MFKYFTLFLISSSFFVHAMEREQKDNKPEKTPYGLVRFVEIELPTIKDIQYYQDTYGEIPKLIENFYLRYGNCAKKGLDILTIYGKENSSLSLATQLVRKYLEGEVQYHAFAFDQAAGGYWVYHNLQLQTDPLQFQLFSTLHHTLVEGKVRDIRSLFQGE